MKARVFERSEFRAAPIREEHRGPMRLHRIGECPAMAVLLTFDKTKVSRANSAEALFFANQLKPSESGERREAEQVQSFRPLRVRVPF